MRSRAIVVIALASSGCGRFGFDVVDLGDDGPDGDGSIADTAPPCLGTSHLLVDNFDDTTYDAAKWAKAYQDATSRQIRERAGRTYREASPDGVAWTNRHDEPSAATTQTLVTLAADYDSLAASQDDVVRFDNLNGGGAPPSCP